MKICVPSGNPGFRHTHTKMSKDIEEMEICWWPLCRNESPLKPAATFPSDGSTVFRRPVQKVIERIFVDLLLTANIRRPMSRRLRIVISYYSGRRLFRSTKIGSASLWVDENSFDVFTGRRKFVRRVYGSTKIRISHPTRRGSINKIIQVVSVCSVFESFSWRFFFNFWNFGKFTFLLTLKYN
jgi:hypothetical protein